MNDAEGADHRLAIRRQQIADYSQRAIARATVRLNQRTRGRANAGTPNGVPDQTEHRLVELASRSNLDGGAIGEKCLRNLTEVLHVRTEDHRLSIQSGLEDVVTASRNKASANEDDGRNLVKLCELTDRVQYDGICARLGINRQLAPADHSEPLVPAQPLHFVKAFGVPCRDDEQRVDSRGPNAVEGANHRLLFAFQRAARDDHRTCWWHAEEPEHALPATPRRGRRFE